jgi:histidinol dehydrogenase
MMNAKRRLSIIQTDMNGLNRQIERLGLRAKMTSRSVVEATTRIVEHVREQGDKAIIELTQRFDKVLLTPEQLEVTEAEIGLAMDTLDPDLIDAIHRASENIRYFHEAQLTEDVVVPTAQGGRISLVNRPLDTIGVYVPGGTAPLPSSVLMNVLPARVANVRRVILCTPPRRDGSVDPSILVAASVAGVDALYRVGGAQAIAAMAYGTQTIPAVDKIVGPGNIYVNTAKRLVFGQVDIDLFAGPSEIVILADETANPAYIASDLLSQAEHDPMASALLVTDSRMLAEAVLSDISRRIPLLPRAKIISQSLADYGALLVVPDRDTAVAFVNELAPEHLELMLDDPEPVINQIRNAGAIFVGPYSPEPLGDYMAGTNHVLPTNGTARFSSPLNTQDFIKKISVIQYTQDDLADCHEAIECFAEAEQLKAHAESIRVRFGKDLMANQE